MAARFRTPLLARAVLDDPAFSPDPRAHPLAHVGSYKSARMARTIPSSPSSPSLSSESDSLASFSASTSPTLSSATSHSQSPTPSRASRTPSPVSLLSLSPPDTPSPLSKVTPKRPPVPEIPPKLDSTNTPARDSRKPIVSQNTNVPRKGGVKALVRRLTSRHNLDRIDELDETDPFGGSYHHGGPYEAIGGNLPQPSLPYDAASRRGSIHHSKWHEFPPRPLHPSQHQPISMLPSVHGETGLSLNLEPGQILQQNTFYDSHASSKASVASQLGPQPNAIATRPDHSRSLSLPNTQTRSPEDSSTLEILDGFQHRPSSFPHAPRGRYPGDNAPHIPYNLPLPHNRDAVPYVHRQPEMTVFPPPRYESRFHSSGPPRSSQRIPQPSFNPTSRNIQSAESEVHTLSPHARHKSVHVSDSSYTHSSTVTRASSGVQDKPLEPPRTRHLPKRLVMPALLQPQPPQLQHRFPPTEAAAWQDDYLDDHALEGAHFKGQPAMYSQEPRLLRKRSSAFPAKTPIPFHVPMSQDAAAPITGNSPVRTANEAEGTKERARRRRLSKRRNDI